jgi:hypothetical protein
MTGVIFNKMVDDLVDFALQHDEELVSGIKWLDTQAQKDGVSFYDKVYEVLLKKDTQDKAKQWLLTKNKKGD